MATTPSPAEQLPPLYRALLDMVVELERRGGRATATRVRAEATRIYSTAWDEAGRRRLMQLHDKVRRDLDAVVSAHPEPPRLIRVPSEPR